MQKPTGADEGFGGRTAPQRILTRGVSRQERGSFG